MFHLPFTYWAPPAESDKYLIISPRGALFRTAVTDSLPPKYINHCDPRPLEVPGLKQVYFMRFWIRKKNLTFIFLGI